MTRPSWLRRAADELFGASERKTMIQEKAVGGVTYTDIQVSEVKSWKQMGARLIDVREPSEYMNGHVPGAENIPLGRVMAARGEIVGPVVVVCASGNRSKKAAGHLVRCGVTQVANVVGGTAAWAGSGRPVSIGRGA